MARRRGFEPSSGELNLGRSGKRQGLELSVGERADEIIGRLSGKDPVRIYLAAYKFRLEDSPEVRAELIRKAIALKTQFLDGTSIKDDKEEPIQIQLDPVDEEQINKNLEFINAFYSLKRSHGRLMREEPLLALARHATDLIGSLGKAIIVPRPTGDFTLGTLLPKLERVLNGEEPAISIQEMLRLLYFEYIPGAFKIMGKDKS